MKVTFGQKTVSVLLVDLQRYGNIRDVAQKIYAMRGGSLWTCDVIVIRSLEADVASLLREAGVDRDILLDRVGHCALHFMYLYDFGVHLSPNINHSSVSPFSFGPLEPELLQQMRRQELLYLIRHSPAIVGRDDGYLYRLPSGSVSNIFDTCREPTAK